MPPPAYPRSQNCWFRPRQPLTRLTGRLGRTYLSTNSSSPKLNFCSKCTQLYMLSNWSTGSLQNNTFITYTVPVLNIFREYIFGTVASTETKFLSLQNGSGSKNLYEKNQFFIIKTKLSTFKFQIPYIVCARTSMTKQNIISSLFYPIFVSNKFVLPKNFARIRKNKADPTGSRFVSLC